MRLLLHDCASYDSLVCVCTRAHSHDQELLNKGMKGEVIKQVVETEINFEGELEENESAVKVRFSEETSNSKDDVIGEKNEDKNDNLIDLPGDDNVRSKETKGQGQGRVVMLDHIYSEPVEEFDVAYKDDLVKMKEMGLPLGFLNVSPYEVDDNNGLVEVPLRNGRCRRGKKKKKRVVEEEMREEFDRDWWPVYGDSKVMEVWQERYGQYMEAGEENQAQEWQDKDLDENDEEGTLEEQWKEYENVSKADGKDDIETDNNEGVAGWGETNKEYVPGQGATGWEGGKTKEGGTNLESESSTSVTWGEAPEKLATVSAESGASWGQGGGGGAAGGWGEALCVSLPDSSSSSSVIGDTPVQQWGGGKENVGEGWGEVSTWGGGGGEGDQADWDKLWVEVTNEVYQAELIKWVAEKENSKEIVVEMSKCKVANVEVDDAVIKDDLGSKDKTMDNNPENKRNDKWHKQKVVSGLGVILKQLQGDCSEESEENNLTEVIEKPEPDLSEIESNEILLNNEDRHELVGPEYEDVPGLANAQKAFDQLGFVFEPHCGERFEGTPAIRYIIVFTMFDEYC